MKIFLSLLAMFAVLGANAQIAAACPGHGKCDDEECAPVKKKAHKRHKADQTAEAKTEEKKDAASTEVEKTADAKATGSESKASGAEETK